MFSIYKSKYTSFSLFFFFNDTATTEIYTLSLHDALPICSAVVVPKSMADHQLQSAVLQHGIDPTAVRAAEHHRALEQDRKSTRLNSSHANISYAVFCLKKKKKHKHRQSRFYYSLVL